ncbi:MAG TPA: hypothetical protein PK747_06095 [Acidobacteriota bacterium]|nr:hypothetical protein [Acidobacteriota bacterium]HNT18184.1 hypothetical protein [Acidobacteriota bacterium]HQO19919.1 hypothetical protein [Acidobacteriota bacterium]HQQ46966.1 hypothetical protein [Acidobacteriota bacterium]
MADIDFVRKLKGELKAWISEGIIAPEQEERILSRYRVLEEAEEKAGSSTSSGSGHALCIYSFNNSLWIIAKLKTSIPYRASAY